MFIVINTTYPNSDEGRKMLQKLQSLIFASSLASCIQTWQIASCYKWQGEVVSDNEIAVSIKTSEENFFEISSLIRQNHCYELPEIIYCKIAGGSSEYLEWLSLSISHQSQPE